MEAENLDISNKVYFKNLDVLRALAAFMVVFVHVYESWTGWFGGYPGFIQRQPNNEKLSYAGEFTDTLIKNGVFGVDLFFLISGFLITYLLLVEKEKFGKINIIKFFSRRSLRIWPLYFFIIAITPFIVKWLHKPSPDYLSNALFLNNYHTILKKDWEFPFSHLWSICVEEHFYIFWPFVIAFTPFKRLLNVLTLLLFSSIIYRAVVILYLQDGHWFRLYLDTGCRIDAIIIGAIGAYYHFKKPFEFETPKFVRVILLCTLIFMLMTETVMYFDPLYLACFKKYGYLALSGFLMLNFLFNKKPLLNFQKKSIFHYFGKISYGIYMYGNLLVILIMEKIVVAHNLNDFYLFAFINLAGTVLISALSYELFEKPFLKLKTKFELIKTQR